MDKVKEVIRRLKGLCNNSINWRVYLKTRLFLYIGSYSKNLRVYKEKDCTNDILIKHPTKSNVWFG